MRRSAGWVRFTGRTFVLFGSLGLVVATARCGLDAGGESAVAGDAAAGDSIGPPGEDAGDGGRAAGGGGGTSAGGGGGTSAGGGGGTSAGGGGGTSAGGGGGASAGGGGGGTSAGGGGGSAATPAQCPLGAGRCDGGTQCCAELDGGAGSAACAPTCPSPDSIECLQPSDCSGNGAGSDCCGTLVLNGGFAPNCSAQSFSTVCGTCTSSIQVSCNTTDALHICNQGADCSADTGNPNCCQINPNLPFVCINDVAKIAFSNCR